MTPWLKWATPMAAVLGIACWLFIAERNVVPVEINTRHVPASGNASEAAQGSTDKNTDLIAAEPTSHNSAKSPSAAMQVAFAKAADWRAFAISALQRPSEGGRYYAIYAADLCGRNMPLLKEIVDAQTAKGIATSSTVSAQRLAAVEKFFSRCAAFAPGETKEIKSKAMGSMDGADPLVKARDGLLAAYKNKDVAQFRQSALSALQTADALLLSHEELLQRLLAFNSASPSLSGKDYWFDGEIYRQDDALRVSELLLAMKLGTCHEDSRCALDEEIAISCATGDDTSCQADRGAYLKGLYVSGGGNEQDFGNVIRLAGKVRNAIATANVDAFVRPN